MKLVWWFRGGIQLNDAYLLCREDTLILNDIIKENLDTAKEIGQPFW
jgi:coproporphyrinogen III oxidase|tara:strand:- start:1290 stop:1430 length:141 start_codon:yes stop_codon:yes gene_type:complete